MDDARLKLRAALRAAGEIARTTTRPHNDHKISRALCAIEEIVKTALAEDE